MERGLAGSGEGGYRLWASLGGGGVAALQSLIKQPNFISREVGDGRGSGVLQSKGIIVQRHHTTKALHPEPTAILLPFPFTAIKKTATITLRLLKYQRQAEHQMKRNEKEKGGVVSTGIVWQASSSEASRNAPLSKIASSLSQALMKAPLQAARKHHVRFVGQASSSGALRKAPLSKAASSLQASRKAPLQVAKKQHVFVGQASSSGALRKAALSTAASSSSQASRKVAKKQHVRFEGQESSSGALRKAPLSTATSSSSQASRKTPLQVAKKQHVSQQQLQTPILQSNIIELQKQVSEGILELRSLGLSFAGFEKCRQNVRERTNEERFSASYGVSARTLHAVMADLALETPRIKTKDFLMAVNELKLYLTEHVQAGRWGIDENTFRNRWKDIVIAIAALKEKKIKFDPDDFPQGQVFIMSVDGVNFTIHEPRAKNPGSHWYDHKSHSAGISYEVAIDVRRSRILWINGPRPGKWCCTRYSLT